MLLVASMHQTCIFVFRAETKWRWVLPAICIVQLADFRTSYSFGLKRRPHQTGHVYFTEEHLSQSDAKPVWRGSGLCFTQLRVEYFLQKIEKVLSHNPLTRLCETSKFDTLLFLPMTYLQNV